MKRVFSIFLMCVFISLFTTAQTNKNRVFQIGFVTPLGTNGVDSRLVTNKISFNVLGGYSYGNTVFEFGSLYNVNTHLTSGVQFAGIVNYSGKAQNAFQIAGVTNIATRGNVATQFSGVANIAKNVDGVQFSGVTNTTKNIDGLQFAGVANIAKNVDGLQFAGVANIAKNVDGVQFSGVTNTAKNIDGLQFSGVANIAKNVDGLQLGGVVNIAKNVDGVQIGLINYSDTNDGLPIGLINIVKHGGKHELEVSFSEALNTAVSFKLGTDKLYTIFSGGVNYLNKPVEYAAGLGLGTHVNWKKGWGNQIELIGYSLTEKGSFENHCTNLLTQLKLTISKDISKKFKLFAGPVVNMTISDYRDPETGALGSSLSPWSMWKNNSKDTRLNAWIGFAGGVRFF